MRFAIQHGYHPQQLAVGAQQRRAVDGAKPKLPRQRSVRRQHLIVIGSLVAGGSLTVGRQHRRVQGGVVQPDLCDHAVLPVAGIVKRQQPMACAMKIDHQFQQRLQRQFQSIAAGDQLLAQRVQPLQVSHLLAQFGLRVLQPRIQLLALGDIHRHTPRPRQAVVGRHVDAHPRQQPARLAVFQLDGLFALVMQFTAGYFLL